MRKTVASAALTALAFVGMAATAGTASAELPTDTGVDQAKAVTSESGLPLVGGLLGGAGGGELPLVGGLLGGLL